MTVIIKLKNIKCSVIKLDKNNKVYVDNRVKIEDSPWVVYLKHNDTKLLFDSFYATRKHPKHDDNYWYDLENFDKLVNSIKINGYKNELCNNSNFQDDFNGKTWQGGLGPIKISKYGNISDGHHRCAILYYLYGPEFEIEITNNYTIKNIPPLPN